MKRYKHQGKNIKPRKDGEWVRHEDFIAFAKNVHDMDNDRRERRFRGLRRGIALQLHYQDQQTEAPSFPPFVNLEDPSGEDPFEKEAWHRYQHDSEFNARVQHWCHNLFATMVAEEARLNEVSEVPT